MRWTRLAGRRPFEAIRRLCILIGIALGGTLIGVTPALADDRPDGSELATAGSMMAVIVVFFIVGILGIWWAWSNGEFEEPEDVKYQMLAVVDDEVDFWGMGTHDDEDEDDYAYEEHPIRTVLAHPVVS